MRASSKSNAQSEISPLMTALASPLGDHLFFFLSQVEHDLHTRLHESLAEFQLDVRQYSTLAFIAGGQLPTQHELAKILHLDPSQIVKLIKALVARGLLTRETLPQDRRARALIITDEGQRLVDQAAIVVQRVEESVTASLSRRDRSTLQSLLDRVLPLS